MLNRFKIEKFVAKYMVVLSLAITTIALNNYCFFLGGEPKLPKDVELK